MIVTTGETIAAVGAKAATIAGMAIDNDFGPGDAAASIFGFVAGAAAGAITGSINGATVGSHEARVRPIIAVMTLTPIPSWASTANGIIADYSHAWTKQEEPVIAPGSLPRSAGAGLPVADCGGALPLAAASLSGANPLGGSSIGN